MLHGAKVILELVLPWINTHRPVCADSYFASVPSAILLHNNGLKFAGDSRSDRREVRRYMMESGDMMVMGVAIDGPELCRNFGWRHIYVMV